MSEYIFVCLPACIFSLFQIRIARFAFQFISGTINRDNLISISMVDRISMGIEEGSERRGEFSEMADRPKATKMLESFLQSDPSLPSTSSRISNESFSINSEQSSCMKSSYSFPPEVTVCPATFGPGSPCGKLVLSNPSACPSPWILMSPLHSPVVTPLPDEKSYGCITTTVRQDGHVYALAVSGDGLLYTGSESENIRVWKQPSFDEYGCFKSGFGSVKALLIASDYIFSAHQDRKIRVWHRPQKDSGACRRLTTLPTMKDQIQSSLHCKNYVQVRRHHKALWIKHVDVISSLAFKEERGLLYSGSWDKTVKVWRMRNWKCVESIVAHDDAVSSVAVASDGLLFTGSADKTVKVWAMIPEKGKAKAKHVLRQTLSVQQSAAVNALALSTDGAILYSGSANGAVNVWEREKPIYVNSMLQHAGVLRGHRLAVLCLATVKNLLFSGSADKSIQVWKRNANSGLHSCLAVLQGHTGPVKCIEATVDVSVSNGFLVYSGSMDGSLKVWRVDTSYDPTS